MANQSSNRGVPSIVSGLMRPSQPPADAGAGSAEPTSGFDRAREMAEAAKRAGGFAPSASVAPTAEPDPAGEQPSAAAPSVAARASRKRRPSAPVEKTNKRGLYLGDDVWDRLSLEAHHKRTTASNIAQMILDKHLPHFTLNREG